MLRARIGFRTWRLVHWSAYACWPIALVHSLGTGSDVKGSWLLAISIICILAVLAALAARALAAGDVSARLRGAALGGAGAFSLFLVLWLPSGPLGAEWARRAGTPSSLLHHARSK
jgi:sulfoxide reductase heme-binding subunit YedZ